LHPLAERAVHHLVLLDEALSLELRRHDRGLKMVLRAGEILHLDVCAREGRDEQLADAIRFHHGRHPSRNAISAFCTWSLFSAWSQTTERGPSITSSVISSPRCAGRQCITIAEGFGCASIDSSSCQPLKSWGRFPFAPPWP